MTSSNVLGMELWVCRMGVVDYRDALDLQERTREARQAGAIPDVMLLLEHPPTYTRGRRAGDGELPLGEDWYRDRGIEIVDVRRGGKVTYHGPGQLVGYPIVGVDDVLAYVRTLENGLVAALHAEGLSAARSRPQDGPDYTGVWVAERKIASIGVHVRRGVAAHGFAVNVDNDLEPFRWIVPCGLAGVHMTSVAAETGRPGPLMACFARRVAFAVASALGRRQRLVSPARLRAALEAAAQPTAA
ncbi:MAG: lipoyl(octanoyl) transferase LipB [Solirubrobacterales bacterium]|nr:lipoyl(octanoyl) transferase LipB [Solirubrobacterales bacterium]